MLGGHAGKHRGDSKAIRIPNFHAFGEEILKTITIIGRGLNPSKHLTLEGIDALKRADAIFGIEPDVDSWRDISHTHGLVPIQQVGHLYRDGAVDQENYESFLRFIERSLETYNNISLLVAGHPRVGVTFVQRIEKMIGKFDDEIEVRFIPNVSSFDMMIDDLKLDPLEQGAAILDANRVLLFQMPFVHSCNYFIYHVCSVGTSRTCYSDPQVVNKLTLLKKYLEKYYPSNKTMKLCRAENGNQESSRYLEFTLSDLDTLGGEIDYSTTLFIPAEFPRSVDLDYLKMLKV
jgi:uncharacterized protein YabN with tetrapyrrole methylase and pyrophosphatase domain